MCAFMASRFGLFVVSIVGLGAAWALVASIMSGEIRMCVGRWSGCVTHTWASEPGTFLLGLLFPALALLSCLLIVVFSLRARRS
jgi:hypothetical protein